MTALKTGLITIGKLNRHLDDMKVNQGIALARINEAKQSANLQDFEFKVFSQWGEDGILQRLTQIIDVPNKTFIEFGVEDFFESNCRFLMVKDNWQGFVIDGSAKNIARLQNSYFFWRYDLQAETAFITKDNINDLLQRSGFDHDLGILSVDIDGNDYYVLDAIEEYKPRILICEFNGVFGTERKISVPYDASFVRAEKHYSHLYFGASLPAMTHLAAARGYTLVGINSMGNNAFFVRNDLMNENLQVFDYAKEDCLSHLREGRNPDGSLSLLRGTARLDALRGLDVINVETGETEKI